MKTEELKRSQESYVQKVLELAKEVSRTQTQSSIQELYWALRDITYGLGATIKGIQDLQGVYGLTGLGCQFQLDEIKEILNDYYSIARTASVEALETMKTFIEHELGVQKASKVEVWRKNIQ